MLLLLLQLQPKTKPGLIAAHIAIFNARLRVPLLQKNAPGVRAGQKQRQRRNANDLEYKSQVKVQQRYRGKELSEARDVKIHRLSFNLQRADPAGQAPGHDGTLSFGVEIYR